ncbi:MAG: LysM peptidoglycan-binding domain-containing protein [bacterium]|nr:LysM peptidoglycan-binding domain-containing protein [bacterium]
MSTGCCAKRIWLISIVLTFLVALLAYAQEKKLTKEQALQLIEEYKVREAAANAKIGEESLKLEAIKAEIAELDKKIADLEAQIAKLKPKEVKPKIEKKVEVGDIYIVKPGDWLSKLAEYPEVYGRGNYAKWHAIYEANKDLIKNPDLIYPGWKLKIPRP